MSEVWVTNWLTTVRLDEEVREYIETQLKSQKSVWHSRVLDTASFTIYHGDSDYSQINVLEPDEIILGGDWNMVNLAWGSLDPAEVCAIVKNAKCHKTIEFSFPSEYSIAFDRAMYWHVSKQLIWRAQSLLDTEDVFLMIDGFKTVYIEGDSSLLLKWESDKLSIEMEGEFPFISKKGFVTLGDVMFYIPPQRR